MARAALAAAKPWTGAMATAANSAMNRPGQGLDEAWDAAIDEALKD